MSSNDWVVAAVGVAGAVIGGVIGGGTPQFISWCLRPKLKIDYVGDNKNQVTIQGTGSDGRVRTNIFVRAKVQNKGRRRAKSCQVFLIAVHEIRTDGSAHPVLQDSKLLQWAGGSKAPLDVPQGDINFYVDLLMVSKDVEGWGMYFGLFTDQQVLERYSGTYRFTLIICGDNAAPTKCSINVEYKQDWHTLRAWQV